MDTNPLIVKVLERFPDVAGESLPWPQDTASWTERDISVFVGSGGYIRPKQKKVIPIGADGSGGLMSTALVPPTPQPERGSSAVAAAAAAGPCGAAGASDAAASAGPAGQQVPVGRPAAPKGSALAADPRLSEDLFGTRRGRCTGCSSCPSYRRWPGFGGG